MPLDDVRTGLTYDDVLLVPRRSRVRSRRQVSLRTRLSGSIDLDLPVVAANMDTVCESEMAIALARLGGIGIIHRFLPTFAHALEVEKVKLAGEDLLVGVAVAFALHGIAFANFKAHKFSYLNITSFGTDLRPQWKRLWCLHVSTYRHVSPITWLHFMTPAEESYVNCSHLTSTTTRITSPAANFSITSVLW